MSLKQVELVRERVTRGVSQELTRVRVWLSMTDGNAEPVEQLRGEPGVEIVAVLTDTIMRHLGHVDSEIDPREARSHARRVAKKFTSF